MSMRLGGIGGLVALWLLVWLLPEPEVLDQLIAECTPERGA